MTTDIKELRGTERLIRLDCLFDGKAGCACSHCEASDTIARLAAERDRLKAALETIAHDNVPREVFIVWRTDGSNSKHDKCQHMRMMYEDCGNCTALFARKALGDAP